MSGDIVERCEKHPNVVKTHPECNKCDGDGYVTDLDSYDEDGISACYMCRGKGISPWKTCEWCDEDYIEEQFESGVLP